MIKKNVELALWIVALLLASGVSNASTQVYRVKKVVIDAGHGGHDAGARGRFSREKNVALQIALELGRMIKTEMEEVEVIYTRHRDEFVTLHGRAAIANRNKADVFISIHCNGMPHDRVSHGTETYTMGVHRSDHNLQVAKRENSVVLMEEGYQKHYEGFDPRSPESHILLALYQSAYNVNSLRLAQSIQNQFGTAGRVSRGVKQAGFLVLWKTAAPSVLVEVGFITHPQEEVYLNSRKGRKEIASGILNAFREYRSHLEVGL